MRYSSKNVVLKTEKFFIMKWLLFLFSLTIGLINTAFAQKNSYGISVGTGSGLIVKSLARGGASYDLKTGFSIGFYYASKFDFNEKLSIQSGLSYYRNTLIVTPAFNPDIDMTPRSHNLQMIYLSTLFKFDLSKYFFINTGSLLALDISSNKTISNQTGLGAMFGLGTEISINENFAIQFNPYFNIHSLIPIFSDNTPERIVDTGIKMSFILK